MLRRLRTSAPEATVGRARVGRRTKDLVRRLEPGEIAVIDHADLDRVAADALVSARVAGVVNAGGTILGLMPHPERAAESALGGTDGLVLFHSLLGTLIEDGTFLKR